MRGITLITMGAGNVIVLEETLKSFKRIVNEVIYGDMLLFPEDREVVNSYKQTYNLTRIELPFNFLYKNGFSELLNHLASFASNDMVLYVNTSEIIDENYGINDIVNNNPKCNSFFFTHRTERFRWFRCYNRFDLKWSGRIHEELVGHYFPYHKPIFMMADLEKDLQDPFKTKCLNSTKELVYWNQLIKIVDNPSLLAATSPGWLEFAKDNYQSMKDRIAKKGKRPQAMEDGDYKTYMLDFYSSEDFQNEIFKSSNLIAFQGDKIHL